MGHSKNKKYRFEARKRMFSLLKEAKEIEKKAELQEEKAQDEEMITEPYYFLDESERLNRLYFGDPNNSFIPNDVSFEDRVREQLHEEAVSYEEEAKELRGYAKDIVNKLVYNNDSYRRRMATKLKQAICERDASKAEKPLRIFLKEKSKKRKVKPVPKKSKEKE